MKMGYSKTRDENAFTLALVFILFGKAYSLPYDVHWLGGSTTIERDVPSSKQSIDVYCYAGTAKTILSLWQTVKFHIKINNNEFSQYLGNSPEEVYKEYTQDSYGWSVVNPFQKKVQRTVSVELFNTTCMAINTKQKHTIELQIIRVDIWRVLLMALGISLIFLSKSLSGNPVFFYLCGMLLGIFASVMVLVYYISKLLPKKTLTYGILIGGWTVGVYVLQQVWENLQGVLAAYRGAVLWYTLAAGLLSFLVCYRIGPPRDQRSKNVVMWTLQALGVALAFYSSEHREAGAAAALAALAARYFPRSLLRLAGSYWRRRFPPKPRLLTSEEYYEQGARETRRALENLRQYCSSPDCAQWRVMLKLEDSKRFASFVEGNSHLSDDEVLDYEAYAFSLDRSRKPHPVANSTANNLEISDDDSSGSELDI